MLSFYGQLTKSSEIPSPNNLLHDQQQWVQRSPWLLRSCPGQRSDGDMYRVTMATDDKGFLPRHRMSGKRSVGKTDAVYFIYNGNDFHWFKDPQTKKFRGDLYPVPRRHRSG